MHDSIISMQSILQIRFAGKHFSVDFINTDTVLMCIINGALCFAGLAFIHCNYIDIVTCHPLVLQSEASAMVAWANVAHQIHLIMNIAIEFLPFRRPTSIHYRGCSALSFFPWKVKNTFDNLCYGGDNLFTGAVISETDGSLSGTLVVYLKGIIFVLNGIAYCLISHSAIFW